MYSSMIVACLLNSQRSQVNAYETNNWPKFTFGTSILDLTIVHVELSMISRYLTVSKLFKNHWSFWLKIDRQMNKAFSCQWTFQLSTATLSALQIDKLRDCKEEQDTMFYHNSAAYVTCALQHFGDTKGKWWINLKCRGALFRNFTKFVLCGEIRHWPITWRAPHQTTLNISAEIILAAIFQIEAKEALPLFPWCTCGVVVLCHR